MFWQNILTNKSKNVYISYKFWCIYSGYLLILHFKFQMLFMLSDAQHKTIMSDKHLQYKMWSKVIQSFLNY
jgi:hypothetical protein